MARQCTNADIQRLQDSLVTIRNAGGWSAEEFGDMIGVTKQSISNLENGSIAMSKTQYIAIRSILDYEIEQRKQNDNDCLSSVVNLCLNTDGVSPEDMTNARAYLSGASKKKMSKKVIIGALVALVGSVVVATLDRNASEDWLGKLINHDD